jgi:hypothetical protein
MAQARLDEILRLLAAERIDAIVVGMLAGVLQGAPVTTGDLDIVHRRTPENVNRLVELLRRIGARYRHDPRRIVPGETHLAGPGHQLLETDLGDLDCLGEIDGGKSYEDLLSSSIELELGEGLKIRVLGLPALIEVKRRAGRPKDLAVLPLLQATLDERGGRGDCQ